jgi:protein-tyrosine phosphatase
MAERLLASLVAERLGDDVDPDAYVLSESAGTSGWHIGERMYRPTLAELQRRGAVEAGFRARQLTGAHIDTADLILTATADHLDAVQYLRPDAANRSFVLGEFGRLLAVVDGAVLDGAVTDDTDVRSVTADTGPDAVYQRGVALVAAVNKARNETLPDPYDDLQDPWGQPQAVFARTADTIEATLRPFVDRLLPVLKG